MAEVMDAARVTRLSRSWPPVRSRGIDLSGATFELLTCLGIVRRTDVAGVFSLMPLGLAIRDRMESVVRQTFLTHGFAPVSFPSLQSRAMWQRSGRWAVYAEEGSLFQVTGRRSEERWCLAPTSEEMAVDTVAADLRSYRDLPVRLYLSTTKFRDEISPRGGLMRAREFEMADAYTFDRTPADMARSLELLNKACQLSLRNVGFVDTTTVPADGGDISRAPSTEHVVVSDIGQSEFLRCPGCGYLGDPDVVSAAFPSAADRPAAPTTANVVKVLAFRCALDADSQVVSVAIRGDLQVSERKLLAATGASSVRLLATEELLDVFGVDRHFVHPKIAASRGRLLYDQSVVSMKDFVVADPDSADGLGQQANWGTGPLLSGVLPDAGSDLHRCATGVHCGQCGKQEFQAYQSVELAHVFELGRRYTEPMGLRYRDARGEPAVPLMACSGIGLGRCLQTLAHVRRDERGLHWPSAVAPADVHLVPVSHGEAGVADADQVARRLAEAGLSVLIDDREVSTGERFRYAWALGVPHHLVVSRRNGRVRMEWVRRADGSSTELSEAEFPLLIAQIRAWQR